MECAATTFETRPQILYQKKVVFTCCWMINNYVDDETVKYVNAILFCVCDQHFVRYYNPGKVLDKRQ